MTHPGHLSGQDFPSRLPLGQIGLTKVHNVFCSHTLAYLQCSSVVYIQVIIPRIASDLIWSTQAQIYKFRKSLGTTEAHPGHELETVHSEASFTSVWTDRAPTKKDASAPNSTPSSSTEIFSSDVFWKKKKTFYRRERCLDNHVWGRCPSHYGNSLILLHCIKWMESKFFNFNSTARHWNLDKAGCPNRMAIPNKQQN